MSDLLIIEKLKLEKLFGMESGYVLSFSNRTFKDFVFEITGIDIYNPKFDYGSGSKANRLRAFWKKEDNAIVGKLIFNLLNYWKEEKQLNNQIITFAEQSLWDECLKISERLRTSKINRQQYELKEKEKRELEEKKELKLDLLLSKFDEMAILNNPQQRGFMLQDLLNELFSIHKIPVVKSFQRNSGGEQIDGAFSFQNWHYLVECKWTQKLADIRELDSLLGKVNRSGKQTMGLFLSIEGWSENVPLLLKQNPNKCIILMDGYDLRCILSEAIEMIMLLTNKIAKLNLDAEPFCSVVEMLKKADKT